MNTPEWHSTLTECVATLRVLITQRFSRCVMTKINVMLYDNHIIGRLDLHFVVFSGSAVCLDTNNDPVEILKIQLQEFTELVVDGNDGGIINNISLVLVIVRKILSELFRCEQILAIANEI